MLSEIEKFTKNNYFGHKMYFALVLLNVSLNETLNPAK